MLESALSRKIKLDLTRKQISGERVNWQVRLPHDGQGKVVKGGAEARFSGGQVVSFRWGPVA